ncbi:unnamed protein product [Eruca vesicaria subsp. sativa]|uniref:RING-type E3 ubiquitin transferase n=1 Tax=Eruca vesicaria subsp. sativa TaxID=29727 RepID=A0ABC8K9J3_ERUVS|nr:unnamed protein product [Eruca vesicaria subsp. sativa]
MAEMSYLQIHDPNDAVLNHFNRNHRRNHQSLSQILDSLPPWIQSDDDLYTDFTSEVDVSETAEGLDLDLLERRSFVMDLFHQRVEQSQVSPLDDDDDYGSDSGFGVVDGNRDMRGGSLGLESGRDFVDCDVDDDDDDEEDLFDRIRYLGIDSGDVIVTVESGFDFDSDVEEDDLEKENWGIELDEEEEEDDEYVNDDDDSVTISLCHLEDEWEEVDDGDGDDDDERAVFAAEEEEEAEADDNNSVSVSVSATISLEDLAIGERRGYLGWEVLLNSRSLEFNLDDAESNMELYIGGDIDQQEDDEDYLHTTEYEMLFEAEISSGLGKPPASKSFVKNLKVSPLTKEDVKEKGDDGDDAMCCAVCREEMNVGNEVAELPCRHKYHGECIVPWLGIRNTCPVCRFELPSDETEQSRF